MPSLATLRAANRMLGGLAPRAAAHVARRLLMTPHVRAPDARELAKAASAAPITFRFGLAGLRWGEEGPTVLMLHGWQGRPTHFLPFVAPLLAAGRRVIALEGPAHGRSPGREAHPMAFAEALLEAASELRGVESVVGHSMGGSAALIALAHGLDVERAVVLGSPSGMGRVLDRFARTLALPAPAHREFRALVDRHVGVTAQDLDARLAGPHLTLPGLIVHDRDDKIVPFAEAETLAHAWQAAELLATSGLGHRGVLGDPRVVASVTRFLLGGRPLAALC